MTLETLRGEAREEILRLGAKRGVRSMRVFGSVAQRESGEGSDVDFLVEFEARRTLFDQTY